MRRLLTQSIILTLILWCTINQGCPTLLQSSTDDKIDGLQTGSLNLENTKQNTLSQRFHYYPVSLTEKYSSQLEVAVSIIYMNQYCPKSGIDFAVRPIINKKLNTFTVAFIISSSANWNSVHIHYLATNRNDFRAGFFIPTSNQLLSFNTQITTLERTQIFHCLPSRNIDKNIFSNRIRAPVYLSGVKTQDQNFNLEITSTNYYNIKNNEISFYLKVKQTEYPIEIIYVSYILYSDLNGGLLTSSLSNVPAYISNLLKGDRESGSFTGMTAVRGEVLIGITNCKRLLIPQQEFRIQKFTGSFNIEGIIIMKKPNIPLLTTAYEQLDGEQSKRGICFYPNICQAQNGTIKTLKNGTSACVRCGQGKQFNQQIEICVCQEGKVPTSNGKKCVTQQQRCGVSNLYIAGNCHKCDVPICQKPYVFNINTEQCECDSSSGYENIIINSQKTECMKLCPPRTLRNPSTKQCQCRFSNEYIDKQKWQCVRCPNIKKWSAQKQKCICQVPQNQKYDGTCVYCSFNGFFDTQKRDCICKEGFTGNGNICRPVKNQPLQSGITILTLTDNPKP